MFSGISLIKVLAIILLIYFTVSSLTTYNENLYIESDVDNREYIIRKGNLKSNAYLKQSANRLAEINGRIEKLIYHLDKKYSNDISKTYFLDKLKENYNPKILSEAANDRRYTTYTIDKKDMYICLRTRDQKETLYDTNLLMYVILHELAHLCNYDKNGIPIQGHGSEFREIFKLFVIEAIDIGIYDYEDYSKKPSEYCGIVISTTILPKNYDFSLSYQ
jgi:hypothetical protein